MTIQITGSSGFVGQNLQKYLSDRHDEVKGLSLRNMNWRNHMDEDVIVNLVGKAHDHNETATEQDYYNVNVELVKEIFQAFLGSSATLLIHISSLAAVEEFKATEPLTESNDCRPVSLYGKSKREAEEWLMKQELPEHKKLIILRPPMIHGPGDKGNLGLLYKLISKGIPYPLASFDNQRSFISIDNFCYFIEQIIQRRDNLASGIYHVADNEWISTKQIIGIIKEVTNKKVPDLSLPKFLVKGIAKVGDFVPIPLNTKRLKKMTSDLLVSNTKIKQALAIERLPLTAKEGLEKTIRSLSDE